MLQHLPIDFGTNFSQLNRIKKAYLSNMTLYDVNGKNDHKWQYMSISNSIKLHIITQRIFFLSLQQIKIWIIGF